MPRVTETEAFCPTARVSLLWKERNWSDSTLSWYCPGGSPGITASPAPEDTSVRLASVSRLRKVTRACEITLPDGSETETFSTANCCAESWKEKNWRVKNKAGRRNPETARKRPLFLRDRAG